MAATRSENRTDYLAQSKRLPPEYKDDRRSVYWVESVPQRDQDGFTDYSKYASPRIIELSRHRTCVADWKPHRPTPIWPVTAQPAQASERLSYLSEHRRPLPQYSFDRRSEWEIRREALSATPSTRIEQLCMPKKREEAYSSFDPYWGYRHRPISENALKARATERLESLAAHKDYHKDFKNEKPVQWSVSQEALASIATLRLQQMSRPRSRTMIKDDYDPYRVSQSAKKVRATPRLEELCMPIPRKIRQKKVIS